MSWIEVEAKISVKDVAKIRKKIIHQISLDLKLI